MCGLYRRRNIQSDININVTRKRKSILDILENEQPVQNEGTYDMIDESQMIDMPSQNILDSERLSNENSSLEADNEETNCDDGYLNPYQPIVPDLDHHAYGIKNVPRLLVSPTNEKVMSIDECTDGSIPSAESKRNSGYISMRQSLCNNVQMSNSNLHFANKCNVVNNAATQSKGFVATFDNWSRCTKSNENSAKQLLSLRQMSRSDNSITSRRYKFSSLSHQQKATSQKEGFFSKSAVGFMKNDMF
ncbi:unnamed protein product [Mytilus coruscus]|uniref:Uncharacterized protein n=1 Tax=Mytilus coruscus TaxID=42192 RepID=A0A6J8EDE8_MYTCO|nr:unnamed protein product [Mytilus coruscus]